MCLEIMNLPCVAFPGHSRLVDFPEVPLFRVLLSLKVADLGSFQDNQTQSWGLVLGFIACEVQEGSSQPPVGCWQGRMIK